MSEEEHPPINLVFVGEHGVGKTSIIKCYGEDHFDPEYIPTAYNHYELKVMIGGKPILMNLHEFGGKFIEQLKPFIKVIPADAFIIVFSHFEKGNLDKSMSLWHPMIADKRPECLIYFMGSKLDLLGSPFVEAKDLQEGVQVERKQMATRMSQLGSINFECSALTKEGIKESMDTIVLSCLFKKNITIPGIEIPQGGIKIPTLGIGDSRGSISRNRTSAVLLPGQGGGMPSRPQRDTSPPPKLQDDDMGSGFQAPNTQIPPQNKPPPPGLPPAYNQNKPSQQNIPASNTQPAPGLPPPPSTNKPPPPGLPPPPGVSKPAPPITGLPPPPSAQTNKPLPPAPAPQAPPPNRPPPPAPPGSKLPLPPPPPAPRR